MAKLNIQKLLMEKGERVLVGVAGAIAFFLILTQLFMPGHGFFAPNPREFKVKLETVTNQVSTRLRSETNVPGPGDLPDEKKGDPKSLEGFAQVKLSDPGKYRVQELFAVATPADSSRRMPQVLPLSEAQAAFSHTQIRSYILNNQKTEIMVLDGAGMAGPAGSGIPSEQKNLGNFLGKGKGPAGPGPMGPGNFGAGRGVGNFQPPETGGLTDEQGPPARWLPVDKLATQTNVRLAETVRPVRTIVVAASFPYRAQLDEFRTKLRLPSRAAVLAEPSMEVDTVSGQTLPAFRFLGIKAQRMEVDAAGKPVPVFDPTGKPRDPWVDVDLRQDYKEYLVLNGKRFEPEDPALEAISFDRLVMPRLLQMRPGQYPPIEKNLPTLVTALESFKDKALTGAPPSLFNVDDFDPFSRGPVGGPGMGRPGEEGSMPFPMGPGGPRPGFPTPGTPFPGTGGRPMFPGSGPTMPGQPGQPLAEVQPPEHCLVRIVDVKVESGKSYKYRLQVEMANPNYKRTDLASPKYGDTRELPPSPWYEVPNVVVVPSDLHYYAVDQKDLDGKEYKGINADAKLNPNQTVLQIHRWLEKLETPGRRPAYVGEWVVGERLVVGRGEYVGRQQTVEVPVWMERRESFVIPKKKDGQKETVGSPISFGMVPYDTVVVDFNAGETRYDLTEMKNDKPAKTQLRDSQRNEVLLCTPDGRFLALDGAAEAKDAGREKRLEEYRTRVKEVKSQKGPGPMGPGTTGPFSGP